MTCAVFKRLRTTLKVLLCVVAATLFVSSAAVAADNEGNRLKSIKVDPQQQNVEVSIQAYQPIGYRYTVYDSQDPRRVVIDFRGMDVSEISAPIIVDTAVVSEVRVSSFDLTSGKLGRVELLLKVEGDYNVALDEDLLKISLVAPTEMVQVEQPVLSDSGAEEKNLGGASVATESRATEVPIVKTAVQSTAPVTAEKGISSRPAQKIFTVRVENERVLLGADGEVQIFKYFTLTGPTRLVVDVYNVKPDFKKNAYKLTNGFKKLRIGVYKDKIRFVLDAKSNKLPEFGVNKDGDTVVIAWGVSKGDLAIPLPKPSSGPVAIESLDFFQQDATSVFAINVRGEYSPIKPTIEGNIVRYGVQNATIGRELKRVFDSSAFPSSVRLVTPYTVQRSYGQDVMFAVELKGPVDYVLDPQDSTLRFVAQNDAFNEVAPAPVELREVEALVASEEGGTPQSENVVNSLTTQIETVDVDFTPASEVMTMASEPEYSGQKITLVFDNANVRDILQLIADVSNMNIIAGDDVKGKLTIRLVDVPWDQALAIVLDIKGLGKVESGNVVRIMPKNKIRDEETADLDLVDARRSKAPLETRLVSVSYAEVGAIAKQVTPMLTDGRGKITTDLRNKQVIVTDISEVLNQVEELVRLLDTPDRQVMIEARIVEANTTFSNDLGISWGMTNDRSVGASEGDLSNVAIGGGGGFLIAPPSTGSVGSSGLAADFLFGRLGVDDTILDLRLSALESTGNGKVVSSPRVTTLNGIQATIEQGTEIPYQSVDNNGQPKTEFKDATIKLTVTPQINPDQSILMQIDASNNSVGNIISTSLGSVISLNKKSAKTSVLVKDGETTVIGGVFIESDTDSETGVPILKDIPILGHLFKSTAESKERRELLIFITPRILN